MTWTREDMLAELRSVIAEHAEAEADVTEQTELVGDLGIDSLGVMEVVADIEDRFDITVPDSELRNVATFGDVVASIQGKLRERGRLSE